MSEAIIELKNIRKHYGKHEVLKGVDMQINRGDIYGLIGRNGAGKTTIFKMILGLSEITEGTVSIAGSSTRSELYKNRGRSVFWSGAGSSTISLHVRTSNTMPRSREFHTAR